MSMRGFERIKEVSIWHTDTQKENLVRTFENKGFKVTLKKGKEEVIDYILEQVPKSAVVSSGGSASLAELNILEILEKRGNTVLSSFRSGLDTEMQRKVMKKALLSDVFLSSVNAITRDGKIYLVDGVGNRAAGILFGPEKVILIIGKNKIVDDLENAIKRVENIAAPMNARRYYKEDRADRLPPCAKSGKCQHCNGKNKICNIQIVIDRCPTLSKIELIFVDEKLGF